MRLCCSWCCAELNWRSRLRLCAGFRCGYCRDCHTAKHREGRIFLSSGGAPHDLDSRIGELE